MGEPREGPLRGDIVNAGWYVWPAGSPRIEDDLLKIAKQVSAGLAGARKKFAVTGGVVPYEFDGGRRGFIGFGKLKLCCPDYDSRLVLAGECMLRCAICGSVVGPDFMFETPGEEHELCDNPGVTLFSVPGPEKLVELFQQHLDPAATDVTEETREQARKRLGKLGDPALWQPDLSRLIEPGAGSFSSCQLIAEAAENALKSAGFELMSECEPFLAYYPKAIRIESKTASGCGTESWFMRVPPDYDEEILFYDMGVTYDIGFFHPSRFQDDRPKWTGGSVRFFWGGPNMKDLDALRTKLLEEGMRERWKQPAPEQHG